MSDKFYIETKVICTPIEEVELADGTYKRLIHSGIAKKFGTKERTHNFEGGSFEVKSGEVEFTASALYTLDSAPFSLEDVNIKFLYLGFKLISEDFNNAVIYVDRHVDGDNWDVQEAITLDVNHPELITTGFALIHSTHSGNNDTSDWRVQVAMNSDDTLKVQYLVGGSFTS